LEACSPASIDLKQMPQNSKGFWLFLQKGLLISYLSKQKVLWTRLKRSLLRLPSALSELSQVGVRYALNLAKAIEAEVTVYHVVGYNTLLRYGQRATVSSSFQPIELRRSKPGP
jgi:hypothetical protein